MSKEDLEVLSKKIEEGEKRKRKQKMKENSEKWNKKGKAFSSDFKKFITRGNVLDLAVGVIVGGAFTAIINSLSNNILKPIINWILAAILGENSLSEVYTFLTRVNLEDGSPDLAQSIYIDWGTLINAIINFLLIAFTLFMIVRIITNVRKHIDEKLREDEIEKAAKEAEEKAKADSEKAAQEAAAKEKADAEAKAAADMLAERENRFYANVEEQAKLLRDIKELLEKK